MRHIPLCIMFLLQHTLLHAQKNDRLSFTAQSYKMFMKENTPIFNGSEYTLPGLDIEGSPFFIFNTLQPGTIVYDDVWYANVPLQWELVGDFVLTEDMNKSYLIKLNPDKISKFTIGEQVFIRSANPENPEKTIGFYQVLSTGKITLLAKRIKTILDRTTPEKNFRAYQEFVRYYIVKEDRSWIRVRGIGDLMRAYPNQQAEFKKWLDANPIRFNKEPEKLLLQWATYFKLSNPI